MLRVTHLHLRVMPVAHVHLNWWHWLRRVVNWLGRRWPRLRRWQWFRRRRRWRRLDIFSIFVNRVNFRIQSGEPVLHGPNPTHQLNHQPYSKPSQPHSNEVHKQDPTPRNAIYKHHLFANSFELSLAASTSCSPSAEVSHGVGCSTGPESTFPYNDGDRLACCIRPAGDADLGVFTNP